MDSPLAIAGKQLRNFVRSYRSEPAAPATVATPQEPKDWTVLAYMEGRDRLANSVGVALNGMEEIGSTDQVNLVAQATVDPELGDRRHITLGEMNTRRYYLQRDLDLDRVSSPVLADLGEKKRLDGPALEEFLEWGIRNFPARNYAFVIKKHGLGFAKDGEVVKLSAREMREALENVEKKTGVKPNVLIWDACNMQQLEVAYELKDRAQVMTGSPEAIQAIGFPYPTLLHNLTKDAAVHDARTLGDTVVQSYAAEDGWTTQTAVDLSAMPQVASRFQGLVDAVLAADIPREVLYTDLMKAGSYQPGQTLALSYNFRDAAGFVENLAGNEALPLAVRDAARAAQEALSGSEVSRHAPRTQGGSSVFLPWKDPSSELKEGYRQLAWCRDTGWDRLLDHVLAGAPSLPDAKESHVHADMGLGKMGLYAYKKFVSPHLNATCSHEVSCSQYAREAVEQEGLWEGSKRAFMRVNSCQDGPEHPHRHRHDEGQPLVLHPPAAQEKSSLRKQAEGFLFRAASLTGRVVGGTLAAVVGAPVAAALGGLWGAKAGAGQLDEFNAGLRAKYGAHQTHSLERLEKHFTGVGTAARERFGRVAGAVAGGAAGAALGLVGGAAWCFSYFGGMAGVGLQNGVKSYLGELPVHYRTEQILRADYA